MESGVVEVKEWRKGGEECLLTILYIVSGGNGQK
jgi:hypothetical protein